MGHGGVTCAVKGCGNRSAKNKDVKYHRFPKNEYYKGKWVTASGIHPLHVKGHTRICSLHFKESAFEKPIDLKLLSYSLKNFRNLKLDAIPTEFLPLSSKEYLNISNVGQEVEIRTTSTYNEPQEVSCVMIAKANEENSFMHALNKNGGKNAAVTDTNEFNTNAKKPAFVAVLGEQTRPSEEMLALNQNDSTKTAIKDTNEVDTHVKKPAPESLCDEETRNKNYDLANQDFISQNEDREHINTFSNINTEDLVHRLINDNARLVEENEKLKSRNKTLLLKNNYLVRQLKKTHRRKGRKGADIDLEVKHILEPYFTEGQIKAFLNPNKMQKWTAEDISSAISLRSVSPKAYRFLRNSLKYPLPSLSTLRRWASKLHIEEGFLSDVLTIMKSKSKTLIQREKVVALCFDEIHLSSKISFDLKNEQVIGPCKSAQVIIARSIFGNWKQPIFYGFDQKITKSIAHNAIKLLHESGYETVALSSDMDGGNQGLWRELNISIQRPFFTNPISKEKVYVFADPPHLIKLLRNHFLDHGYILGNGYVVNRNCIEKLLKLTQNDDLKLAHKVTQYHLDVRGSQRQKVKPAVQLFSNTIAKALDFCRENGLIFAEGLEHTIAHFKLVNDWFDIMNSKKRWGEHRGVNAFGVHEKEQIDCLGKISKEMYEMRVAGKRTMLPFQKGIIQTNNAILGLYSDMKTRYGIKYIITSKINTDVLENFFSYIRGMGGSNDHPSALDFTYRLRWYILGKHSRSVFTENKNTEESLIEEKNLLTFPTNNNVFSDNEDELSQCVTSRILKNLNMESNDIDSIDTELETIENSSTSKEGEEEPKLIPTEGLKYITGYVCHKYRVKYPHLGHVQEISRSTNINTDHIKNGWIDLISEGKLITPSSEFFEIAKVMEQVFQEVHGPTLCHTKQILKKLVSIVKEKIVINETLYPMEVLLRLAKIRTYIRIKELNKKQRDEGSECNKTLTKKMKKVAQ